MGKRKSAVEDMVVNTAFLAREESSGFRTLRRRLGAKFGRTHSTIRQCVEGVRPPSTICENVSKSEDPHIGNIALHSFNPVKRRVELRIDVCAGEARGRDLGREACSLVIHYAFDHRNVHCKTAAAVSDVAPVKRVFLELGSVAEGARRGHCYLEGRYSDMHWFGLLRSDLRPCH